MRTFIALCLIAVACANQLGYNYQQAAHHNSGQSLLSSAGGGSSSLSGLSGLGGGSSSLSGLSGLGGGSSSLSGLSGLGGGSSGLSRLSGLGGGSSSLGVSHGGSGSSLSGGLAPAQAELVKEYYTFSAPEEEPDLGNAAEQIRSFAKKSLRVIFIKGPENRGLENAALNLARSSSEQKTAIYVLSKQPDLSSLANRLNIEHNVNSNRPEVHFVKYRTPQDAANAQRQIQAQYDGLGGSSLSHDGGVTDVLNFASQPEVRATQLPQAPGSSYLPSSLFRRLRL